MKKLISVLLVASMLSASICYAENTSPASVSETAKEVPASVIADMNRALPKDSEPKMTTGGWIWLGVIVVIGAVFGSMAINSASSTPK